jgi:hypothetical protein
MLIYILKVSDILKRKAEKKKRKTNAPVIDCAEHVLFFFKK